MHSIRNGSLLCIGMVLLASCVPLSSERLEPSPPAQPAATTAQVRPTLPQPQSGAGEASGATLVPQLGEKPTEAVAPAPAMPRPTNGPTPSSITASATAAPAGGAPASSPASPLKRRDPAPAGVVEQLSFGGGGAGGACGASGNPPDISMRELEIGESWSICLLDFVAGRDIDVQVALPNGEMRQRRVRTTDLRIGAWEWYAMPGDPLGTYVVMATQGDRQVTRTFDIKAPTRPHISMRPSSGPAGTPFQIIMTGFQPNAAGLFPIYRYIEPNGYRYGGEERFYSRYLTSVPIQFNDRGEGTYLLNTRQDDPPGSYRLYLENKLIHYFTLEAPFHNSAQTQAPTESALQRHEPPPADVRLFQSSPISSCNPRPRPEILWSSAEARETEIPFEHYICLTGFAPNEDVPVEVRRPDRRTDRRQVRVNEDGVGVLKWVAHPGDPWGRYTFTATQEVGSQSEMTRTETFTGTFTAGLASEPAIVSFTEPGPPGTAFEILFSGYQPNQRIEPRLYRESRDKQNLCMHDPDIFGRHSFNPVRYLTSLPALQANERGEARLTIQSTPDDPPGTYFVADSEYISYEQDSQRSFAQFVVVSPLTPELRLTPTAGRIGETLQIAAANFHPYECIDLGLYRRTEDGYYTYIESLTNFRADDQGRAMYAFTIAPDFQSGTYVMIRKGVQAEFTVAASQPAATNQSTATAQTDASRSLSPGGVIFFLDPDGSTFKTIRPDGIGEHSLLTIDKRPEQHVGGLSASPDGRYLIYNVDSFYYLVESGVARPLPKFASLPRWSPDGTRFVTQVQGALYIYEASTGQGTLLGVEGDSADWFPDGSRLVYRHNGNLWQYDLADQAPMPLTFLSQEWVIQEPHILHDGERILFFGGIRASLGEGENRQQWWVVPAAGGDPQPFTDPAGNYAADYAASPGGNQIAYRDSAHSSACAQIERVVVVAGILGSHTTSNAPIPELDESHGRYVFIRGMSWSPDASQLAYSVEPYACGSAGQVQTEPPAIFIWNVGNTGAKMRRYRLVNGLFPAWTR